jgi:two-component system sensor histidine kinase QseC
VNLYQLVQSVVADNYNCFEDKDQHIELTANGEDQSLAIQIEGDRFALETLVANLLTNANKYTQRAGTIHVDISRTADAVVLKVEDNGAGIAAEDRERIFARFHRVGGDRHSSGESGCGLGLAIVKNIADLHRATISVGDSSFETGTCFTLTFSPLRSES